MNINLIFYLIKNGKIIYCANDSYKVLEVEANKNSEYQKNHFTYKNGKVLITRHECGFQCILGKSELKDLYIKVKDSCIKVFEDIE